MIKPQRIPVAEIALGERSRRVDPVWVEALAEQIKDSGTRQPQLKDMIEVRPIKRANTPYEIVTGAHRLEAVKSLGWTEIEARVLPLNQAEARLRAREYLVMGVFHAPSAAAALTSRLI